MAARIMEEMGLPEEHVAILLDSAQAEMQAEEAAEAEAEAEAASSGADADGESAEAAGESDEAAPAALSPSRRYGHSAAEWAAMSPAERRAARRAADEAEIAALPEAARSVIREAEEALKAQGMDVDAMSDEQVRARAGGGSAANAGCASSVAIGPLDVIWCCGGRAGLGLQVVAACMHARTQLAVKVS